MAFLQGLTARGEDLSHGAVRRGTNCDGFEPLPCFGPILDLEQFSGGSAAQDREGGEALLDLEVAFALKEGFFLRRFPQLVSLDRSVESGLAGLGILALG